MKKQLGDGKSYGGEFLNVNAGGKTLSNQESGAVPSARGTQFSISPLPSYSILFFFELLYFVLFFSRKFKTSEKYVTCPLG